ACWDGAHQCIHLDGTHHTPAQVEAAGRARVTSTPTGKYPPHSTPVARIPKVDEAECVGCNLCALVCPVAGCITMEHIDNGLPKESWEDRGRNV
ncbi:MAG: 4Fe-4S binding protein, partial [Bryobacteraceae bacterium]